MKTATETLENVRPKDWAPIRSLLESAGLPVHGMEQNADGYVVARQGSDVVGVGGVEIYRNDGLLRSVAVAPERRRNGVGARIVADRLEWARAHGLQSVYLLTETAPEFFEHLGFTRVARETFPEPVQQSWEYRVGCPESAATMKVDLDDEHTRSVRGAYATAAERIRKQAPASCCGDNCEPNPVTSDLYDNETVAGLPERVVSGSLGCGNPTALIELEPGQTVLDLGSGGGLDVLLTAKRVGPKGKAYGLDMTDEMLQLARENQRKAGATNVEFLRGRIEDIPLPDNSVDVIISNCVINLSANKPRVLAEALRVLRPGGRFAVSDIVNNGGVSERVQRDVELVVGCIGGSLARDTYRDMLTEAGFEDVDIQTTRVYSGKDIAARTSDAVSPEEVDGKFMSAFIRARKPSSCC